MSQFHANHHDQYRCAECRWLAEIAGKPIWCEEVVIVIDHRLLLGSVDDTILQLPSRISKRQIFRNNCEQDDHRSSRRHRRDHHSDSGVRSPRAWQRGSTVDAASLDRAGACGRSYRARSHRLLAVEKSTQPLVSRLAKFTCFRKRDAMVVHGESEAVESR